MFCVLLVFVICFGLLQAFVLVTITLHEYPVGRILFGYGLKLMTKSITATQRNGNRAWLTRFQPRHLDACQWTWTAFFLVFFAQACYVPAIILWAENQRLQNGHQTLYFLHISLAARICCCATCCPILKWNILCGLRESTVRIYIGPNKVPLAPADWKFN